MTKNRVYIYFFFVQNITPWSEQWKTKEERSDIFIKVICKKISNYIFMLIQDRDFTNNGPLGCIRT